MLLSSIVERRLDFTEIMSQSANVSVFLFAAGCKMCIVYAFSFIMPPPTIVGREHQVFRFSIRLPVHPAVSPAGVR